MRHTFRGHKYRITFGRVSKDDDGESWTHTGHVNRKLRGRDKLGAEVHELIHLLCPRLSERRVEMLSDGLGGYIWKRGYRLRKERK